VSSTASSHAELMNRIYRRQRYIYDATRKYFLFGRDRLIAELAPAAGQRVLEVGCGTGRNLIKAAKRYPEAHFYGLDISTEMLESAQANIDRAGLGDRITLRQGDATNFDPQVLCGVPDFQRIFFSYSLSMIPPWQEAVDQALRVLSPDGRLRVLDFGQLTAMPPLARGVLFRWLGLFHVKAQPALADRISEIAARHDKAPVEHRSLYRDYCWMISVG